MPRATTVLVLVAVVLAGLSAGRQRTSASILPDTIAPGGAHTCALTDGVLACWGANLYGQLGDGTNSDRLAPVQIMTAGAASVSAGGFHTCIVTAAGGVRCWGRNLEGQLGNGSLLSTTSPVSVTGLNSGVAAIVPGRNHTCALTTAGAALCWSDNSYGQLGDGTTTMRTTPTPVAGLGSGVAAIAGGGRHTCALLTTGALRCWGSNQYGQVGNGTASSAPITTPVNVSGLSSGVVAVATGGFHACAVTTAGAARCWGWNAFGQLGDGTFVDRNAPTTMSGLGSGVERIMAGGSHTCVMTAGDAARCVGDNAMGQVGDGTLIQHNVSVEVLGLGSGVALLANGGDYSCAVATALVCWGLNSSGQLGCGDCGSTRIPTPTAALVDSDRDGCADPRELGSEPPAGGARNPKDFWDFFDTPDAVGVRDGTISIADIARIVGRFGSSSGATTIGDALAAPPPAPAYHAGYDRAVAGVLTGPADGAITIADINRSVLQFGHSCAAPP